MAPAEKRTRGPAACGILALLAHVALAPACAAPTEMTVHVTTNIACPVVIAQGISVAVGEVSSIRDRIPALKTQRCQPAGDGSGLNEVGHVVVVPSGDKETEIAIRVIAGIDVPESECTPDTNYRGCVIERVLLPFVAHENLHVEIRLAKSCKDVPCSELSTCAKGLCVPAELDSATCQAPAGCSNGTLEPPDPPDANVTPPMGGSITRAGGFRIHTFLSSGTFETFGPTTVEYLIVGGGGGGGSGDGGGGGAGGVLTGTADIGVGSFSVVVGAGGEGAGLGEIGTLSKVGFDSSFASFTAVGGGRGGQEDHEDNTGIGGPANAGGNGGSGGGFGGADGSPPFPPGGSAVASQGSVGGTRVSGANPYGMGGGGGAGGGGGNGGATNQGGAGGVGIASSISGAVVFYGGGGGGSGRGGNGGPGGNGGGGNGGLNASGSPGAPNTGGGGGGGGDQATTGGGGGSGVVIIRYPL